MLSIAHWYNNFHAPAVLMIDDLSDAYIDVYPQSHKNDWGYLCEEEGGSFSFLKKELLCEYPALKITFFTPYLRHGVINEKSGHNYKKFALGEREAYTAFLKSLEEQGHEIAHHGSDHGSYIDENNPSTHNNWIHEWALFEDVETGVKTTLEGVKKFKERCGIDVVGGKYCGYIQRENSQEIIERCGFLYWCDKPSYTLGMYDEAIFGKKALVSFPTNFAGNAFVRLSYSSGEKKKDRRKKILKHLQPLYNIYAYAQLYRLYRNRQIISVQEHNSPSTSSGIVQSANIISDIGSLKKIFGFLRPLSVWYATCREIAAYVYVRANTELWLEKKILHIYFDDNKNMGTALISLVADEPFALEQGGETLYSSENRGSEVLNLHIGSGANRFTLL